MSRNVGRGWGEGRGVIAERGIPKRYTLYRVFKWKIACNVLETVTSLCLENDNFTKNNEIKTQQLEIHFSPYYKIRTKFLTALLLFP